MTQPAETLADRLSTYYVTVRFPQIDAAPERPRTLSRRMLVHAHLIGLRSALDATGHRQFLDRLYDDGEGHWRIDLFLPSEEAVMVVVENAQGVVEPGAMDSSAAKEFIEDRLYELGWNE